MTGSDWWRPDRFVDAVRAWTPSALIPPPLAQAMGPVADLFGFAPATIGKDLIDAAAKRLVGRQVTVHIGGEVVSLVLRQLRLGRPPVGLAVGQLGDVELDATHVVVGEVRLEELHLDVRNLHLQPGVGDATLVAAPIRGRIVLGQDAVSKAVRRRFQRVEIELGGQGRAQAYLTDRRAWGRVDVIPRVDGRTLILEPTDAVVGRWRLAAVARRVPPLRFSLPNAFAAAHITGLEVRPGRLLVDVVYEEWRAAMAAVDLQELLRRINAYDGSALRFGRG